MASRTKGPNGLKLILGKIADKTSTYKNFDFALQLNEIEIGSLQLFWSTSFFI
jgi:hypothetical protein